MNKLIVFGAIVAVAMCRNVTDASRHIVKFSDVVEGNVDAVRSSLTGHMTPQQLDKFLNIIIKWRNDSTIAATHEAINNFSAIAFASKSIINENVWIKFMSGDLSVFTIDERMYLIYAKTTRERYIQWATMKYVFKFRMFTKDADLLIMYFGGMQLENKQSRLFAMYQMLTIVLSALSEQPERETRDWVLMDDTDSEWYMNNMQET